MSVGYPKDLRERAKAKRYGLVTISGTKSNGGSYTSQMVVDDSVVDLVWRYAMRIACKQAPRKRRKP